MNPYKVFNYIVFVVICVTLWKYNLFNWYIMIVIGIGFIVGTELLTPDLDIYKTTSVKIKVLFYPYRMIFKHVDDNKSIDIYGIKKFIRRLIYLMIVSFMVVLLFIAVMGNVNLLVIKDVIFDISTIVVICTVISGIVFANMLHVILNRIIKVS